MSESPTKRHWLLAPLTALYGMVIGIRNRLFDWKILPSEEFDLPVISVGNLTVGGTGKTPHTEYLIEILKDKDEAEKVAAGIVYGHRR